MLINRLRANFKNRRQPLIVEITNSGEDRESVCYHHHEFSESVLRGITPNDTWFAFVCGLDPCEDCRAEGKTQPTSSCKFCDDYRDERVWPKANPNLGVSIQIKYLRNLVAEAQGMPTKEADVKRLNFCIWLQAAKRWLSIEKWDDCIDQYSFRDLLAQRCYAGLDMSNKIDLTAFVLHFPDSGRVLPFFWVPAENIPGRAKNDRVPYDLWADPEKVAVPQALGGGYINPTPGNGVDYASVRRDINKLGALFRMEEIGFDPWNTAQLGQELEADGFKMIIVPQRIAHLTNASTELEVLIHTKRIRHDGNPVLRWCISNMVTKKDAGGAIMPDKAKSRERIDGGMALVTGLSRTIVHVGKHSVYNERGVRTL
jgi:phage terminase large subunit-like protein